MNTGSSKNKAVLVDAVTYEYLFVISSKDTGADLRIFQPKSDKLTGVPGQVLKSDPHIGFYYFYSSGNRNAILRKSLQALSGIKVFQVKLNGIRMLDYAQPGKTYVSIEQSVEMQELQNTLQNAFLIKGKQTEPHLTVPASVKADKYALIDPNVSDPEYFGSFDCRRIILLRKRLGEECPYEWVRIINLEG